eukprot:TRINITY_DN8609_c0_g1_i2.p1 TRINITY_DN8609_c0_g1~~TRINITY_DN8609_c0_g1_i2.p1  ORF type:complete len:109 (+),score=39.35 TRINITY_DN8609_c0_g1_i2:147-473(+)
MCIRDRWYQRRVHGERNIYQNLQQKKIWEMPSKRRNNGRSKKNRGNVKTVRCSNCGRVVAKDKAIKRFTVRDIVDASSKRDIKDARAYETFIIPKLYNKLQYLSLIHI